MNTIERILEGMAGLRKSGKKRSKTMVGTRVAVELQADIASSAATYGGPVESGPVLAAMSDDGYLGTVFSMPVYIDPESPDRLEVLGSD